VHTPASIVPSAGQLVHTVAPKETLWRIGQQYGVSHQEIMQLNRLNDPRKLSVGMKLLIPGKYTPQVNVPLPRSSQWTYIVIHHSATKEGNAQILDRSHRKRGFKQGLGYHFVIDNGTLGRADGQIEVGQRWKLQQVGAHCNAGGMNQKGIGICLVGDFTTRPISRNQMDALVYLVDLLSQQYNIPQSRIIRHRDVKGKITACPGDRFPWSNFKHRLAAAVQRRHASVARY
jgi:N-acetyl-anhydromuramyl-L-alanine amidase AmpD